MFYRKNLRGWERVEAARRGDALTRESVRARIHRARLMIREYLIRD